MDSNLVCSFVSPLFGLAQGFVDFSFIVLSLVGIQAPNLSTLFGQFIGCTTGTTTTT